MLNAGPFGFNGSDGNIYLFILSVTNHFEIFLQYGTKICPLEKKLNVYDMFKDEIIKEYSGKISCDICPHPYITEKVKGQEECDCRRYDNGNTKYGCGHGKDTQTCKFCGMEFQVWQCYD